MNPWELRMSPSVVPDHAEFLEPYPLPDPVPVADAAGERIGPAREVRPEPVARPSRKVLVYVSGPIRKGCIWANVAQADRATRELMLAGLAVVNPMLSCWAGAAEGGAAAHPHPLAHGGYRGLGADVWLAMDLEIVGRCDVVLRLPGESTGADMECRHANARGIPALSTVEQVVSWAAQRFPR